jgi:type I restriction enzyme S subunit
MAFTARIGDLIEADETGLLAKHASWARVNLGEVVSILSGAPFDASLFSNAKGHPLVRIRDVREGSTTTGYAGNFDEAFRVDTGDLLVGMDGDFHCAIWRSGAALLNQRVCKLTADERFVDRRFLAFALPGYLSTINANTPSITVKHLSSRTIAEIELALPPRDEQSRIVAKLDELFSDLDAGVAELRAAQKKLAIYRQSLLKAAVDGALTAEWRARNPARETGAQLLERLLIERRARWEGRQLARFKAQGSPPPNLTVSQAKPCVCAQTARAPW